MESVFNGDIINETIVCFKCSNVYHATCRDKRGTLISDSICSKTFLPKFRAISNHYGDDKGRWGNFLYICGSCKLDFIDVDSKLSKSCDVALQSSPLLHCKETQSQSLNLVNGESQTFTSGNINELSFDSSNSDLNVCDMNLENNDKTIHDHIVSVNKSTLNCSDVMSDIKTLTKLNEEVLANIKSLQKLSNEHAANFGKQIDDIIKQSVKSSSQNVHSEAHHSI